MRLFNIIAVLIVVAASALLRRRRMEARDDLGSTRGFRAFMVKNQYKVMCASLAVGSVFVGLFRLLTAYWFLGRLALLFAVIGFVPAGLVVLAHLKENFLGGFWWDTSNRLWATRRSPKTEGVELIVVSVLWSLILIAVAVAIFAFHP